MKTKYADRGPEFKSLTEADWNELCDDVCNGVLWEDRDPKFQTITEAQWESLDD